MAGFDKEKNNQLCDTLPIQSLDAHTVTSLDSLALFSPSPLSLLLLSLLPSLSLFCLSLRTYASDLLDQDVQVRGCETYLIKLKREMCYFVRQLTSAYVSIRQHTSAFTSIRQHRMRCVSDQLEELHVLTHVFYGVTATVGNSGVDLVLDSS